MKGEGNSSPVLEMSGYQRRRCSRATGNMGGTVTQEETGAGHTNPCVVGVWKGDTAANNYETAPGRKGWERGGVGGKPRADGGTPKPRERDRVGKRNQDGKFAHWQTW